MAFGSPIWPKVRASARAALFLHPPFRFKETADSCHLYTATATQVGPVQVIKQP